MAQRKIAVLAGASGLVGQFLLDELLHSDEYEKVICLVRTKLPLRNDKLSQVITDFSDIKKYEFWTEVNSVFCCIGTTIKKAKSKENFRKVDIDIPKKLMEAALIADSDFHLISSIGANANSNNFYLKTKGEVEDYLKHSGIKCGHIYRPSGLLGNRKESRLGEKIGLGFLKLVSVFLIGSLKKYRGISAAHLAKKMMMYSLDSNTQGIVIHENEELIKD